MPDSYEEDVKEAYRANPDASIREIADEVGCSEDTVEKHQPDDPYSV